MLYIVYKSTFCCSQTPLHKNISFLMIRILVIHVFRNNLNYKGETWFSLSKKKKQKTKKQYCFLWFSKEYSEVNKIINDDLFIIPMSAWEIWSLKWGSKNQFYCKPFGHFCPFNYKAGGGGGEKWSTSSSVDVSMKPFQSSLWHELIQINSCSRQGPD